MAQPTKTPIVTYHSTVAAAVPSNANLQAGELAMNIADMKLYTENSGGTVTLLASADAAAGNFTTVDTTNLEVTNIKAKDGTAAIVLTDATGAVTVSSPFATTGNTTLGNASADTVTVTGTITSNLIFTDNTYDIGASGVTRPRNLFLAGNATIGGNIDLTGALDLTNLEVTNIKAKDGTASASIADATGVMTIGSSVLTTTDINGGTIDATAIGGTTPAAGAFTTVSATGAVIGQNVQVTASGSNAFVRVTSTSTNQNVQFYSQDPNAGNRNWAIIGSNVAYGDLNFKVSTAAGGDPVAAGTVIASLTSTGLAVTGTLSATGTISGSSTVQGLSIRGVAADGVGYPLAVQGTTKGIRTSTTATHSAIEGVDTTLSGSYQPLQVGGSILEFTSSGSVVGTISSTGLAVTGTLSATGGVTTGNDVNGVSVLTVADTAIRAASAGSIYLDGNGAGGHIYVRPHYASAVNVGDFSSTGLAVTGTITSTGNVTVTGTSSTGGAATAYLGTVSTGLLLNTPTGQFGSLASGNNAVVQWQTGAVAVTGTLSATGAVTFPAGTVALPSITTSGDTNTGVYFPAADTVGITAGGTQRGAFSSTGLAVTGTLSATLIRSSVVGAQNAVFSAFQSGVAEYSFGAKGSNSHFVINSGGNFGGTDVFDLTGLGVAVTGTLSATGNTTLGDATTDTVTVSGYMGVGGVAASANVGLLVRPAALTTSTQVGVLGSLTATSAATTLIAGVYADCRTVTATYTTTDVASIYVINTTKGAGHTITNHHGVYIADSSAGTNTNGITSLISSGANKFNIYASGTAQNAFAGNVRIGSTVAPTVALDVTGAALISTTLGVTGVSTFAAGTVALPSITTSGDTNTGVYFPAADTVGITVGGTQRGEFSSTGLAVTGALSASGTTTSTGTYFTGSQFSFSGTAGLGGPVRFTSGALAQPLIFYTGYFGIDALEVASMSSTGLAVTGTLSSTGNLTVTGGTVTTGSATALSLATSGGTGLQIQNVTSSVNRLDVYPSATGGAVILSATGTDAAVPMAYYSRGAESHRFHTDGGGTGVQQVAINHTASANRYITLTGSNGGNPAIGVSAGKLNIAALNVTGIPTSAAGLSAGDVYSNGGVLTVV
jgi:hypothetical protein